MSSSSAEASSAAVNFASFDFRGFAVCARGLGPKFEKDTLTWGLQPESLGLMKVMSCHT
jgi:hypothetical protein